MLGTTSVAALLGAVRSPVRATALTVLVVTGASGLAVAQTARTVETAADFSTRDLMRACAAEGGAAGRSAEFCEGFILGTGLLYLELRRAEVIDAWACAEPVPTLRQIRQDFVAWAQDNPEHLGETAINGFWRAMAEVYPCGAP